MNALSDIDILNYFKEFNLNYLQGTIIIYATDISLNAIDYKSHINHLLDIAIINKPYNAVPRLGQGNKVVGLAYQVQPIWNEICKDFITVKKVQDIIYNVLLGDYTTAKNILNNNSDFN